MAGVDAMISVAAVSPLGGLGRLRLRCFSAADQDALVQMHRDPRVRELLIDDFPLDDRRFVSAFLTRMQAFYAEHPGLGIWATEHWFASLSEDHPDYPDAVEALSPASLARALQPRPHFAGWFNLMPMTGRPEEVELGCRLIPSAWGLGLAMDGGALLLDHAFDRLGRERVWAVCHPRHGSVHLRLRMLGFEYDGDRPYDGVPSSHFVVGADAWRHQRALPSAARRRQALAWVKSHRSSDLDSGAPFPE